MRPNYLGRFLFIFAAALGTNCAWADDTPQAVPMGDNTYSITVKATHKFTRNTEKLKEQAMAAATQFCAKEGKQLKVVSAKEDKSMYLVGSFPQVVLTFQALSPGDPALGTVPGAAEVRPVPPPPMNADVLTSELTKLDNLRKKGLLTDEEFAAAKKKLLDRL